MFAIVKSYFRTKHNSFIYQIRTIVQTSPNKNQKSNVVREYFHRIKFSVESQLTFIDIFKGPTQTKETRKSRRKIFTSKV